MLHVEGEGWRDGDSSRMRKMILKSERGKTKNGSLTSLIANVQLILSQFVPNPKPAILNVNGFVSFYCQMYSKHVVCFVSCQAVYYVQSEPNFTYKVTEAIFVVILGAVKINRAIHSPLKDCPPPTGSSLVITYIKGDWTSWVDCVNTADLWTGFVQFSTVLDDRNNNENDNHNNILRENKKGVLTHVRE